MKELPPMVAAVQDKIDALEAERKAFESQHLERSRPLWKEMGEAWQAYRDSKTLSPLRHDEQQYTDMCLMCHHNTNGPEVDAEFCFVEDLPEWAKPAKSREDLQRLAQESIQKRKLG